jgi:pimeloyl-ACP methyl ester carboxylesterase
MLVLVDSGGYPFVSSSVPIGFHIAQIPGVNHFLEYVTPRSLVAASVRNVYGDPSKVTPALVDRYFDMTVRAGNRHALVQRFLQSDFGADVAMIAELKLPTLIVWGSRDRLIPLDYAERFHRDIAGSMMVVFPDLELKTYSNASNARRAAKASDLSEFDVYKVADGAYKIRSAATRAAMCPASAPMRQIGRVEEGRISGSS